MHAHAQTMAEREERREEGCCDSWGRKINFTNSKTSVGRCRDRPVTLVTLAFVSFHYIFLVFFAYIIFLKKTTKKEKTMKNKKHVFFFLKKKAFSLPSSQFFFQKKKHKIKERKKKRRGLQGEEEEREYLPRRLR